MPLFEKRPLQYHSEEIAEELKATAEHRAIKKLCKFTRYQIAQLMAWNAARVSRELKDCNSRQRLFIEYQTAEIQRLNTLIYQQSINI